MVLIPQWKKFYKRWSTWLLGLIPLITATRDFFPTLQDYIPLEWYKGLMIVLSVAAFIALQIKQQTVSGPDRAVESQEPVNVKP